MSRHEYIRWPQLADELYDGLTHKKKKVRKKARKVMKHLSDRMDRNESY